ncbi:hypothetical protein [Comamonas sp. JC664]|uniref:hypothetical protein n=1 Tax=Comamonas sp. JC664 TaxID=2801917 RepID=UPI00174D3BFC|nr:hypothetical protein [Comamonas sp. JC664]MBL0693923.1 hypothetical protein [Comamonas sp. JC664]GHH03737.1 hypothetical protein GCM10012319_72680 [Comamonas sp. KCTC 72670]
MRTPHFREAGAVSNVLGERLARALDAFSKRDEEAALDCLLEAWRASGAQPLADVIQQLSDWRCAGLTPLDMSSWLYDFTRWHPLDIPRLLAGFVEDAKRMLPEAVQEGLETLLRWPRDPRMIPPLLTLLQMPVAEDAQVLKALCAALGHVGVRYDVQPLREQRDRFAGRPRMAGWLEQAIHAGLSRQPPDVDAEPQAHCHALQAAIVERAAVEQREAPTREALLARIRAAPGDDEARRVLADLLLAVGDPLGEFIALQYDPRADRARIAQLLDANRVRWEAGLGSAVTRGWTRFERGFPVSVQLRGTGSRYGIAEPGPAWSTVEEIDWNEGRVRAHWDAEDAEDWGQWLLHPHLRGVTRHQRVSPYIASLLTSSPLPLRHLGISKGYGTCDDALFDALANLPRLSRLSLSDATALQVAACAQSRLASRLEHFAAALEGEWSLTVRPGAGTPVQATLVSPSGARGLAEALRAAVPLGSRALVLRGTGQLSSPAMAHLRAAATTYARVEWL